MQFCNNNIKKNNKLCINSKIKNLEKTLEPFTNLKFLRLYNRFDEIFSYKSFPSNFTELILSDLFNIPMSKDS